MTRIASLVLFLLLVWGCERREAARFRPGPEVAYATSQTDSLFATTRRLAAGDRVDWQIAPLPDRRRTVTTDWWGNGDLGIRDLVTGEFRPLTHNTAPYEPGNGFSPRVSRDGRRIVYEWSWANGRPSELRVMNLDGSGSRVIYQGGPSYTFEAEDWSPDGRSILAWRSREDRTVEIILVPSDSGAVRVVKELDWRKPGRMNFSPDGRFIVYDYPVRKESGERDLYVLDLRTGRERPLVEHPSNDFVLGWAPNSGHVLFGSHRSGTPGAWLTEVVDGRAVGEPVLVRPDLWELYPGAFTPDGSYFYGVYTGNRGMYVAHLDPASGTVAGMPTPLAPASQKRTGIWPRWSPDGRFIASLVNQASPGGAGETAIEIRSAETREAREFPLPNEISFGGPQWLADGRGVLMVGREKARSGLYRMDVQSGRMEVLFHLADQEGIGVFQMKPDGRTLVYQKIPAPGAGGDRSPPVIVAREIQNKKERVLCTLPAIPRGRFYLSMSPDASMLASFPLRGSERELIVEQIEGCETRAPRKLLTMSRGALSGWPGIAWSPDARSIVYLRRATDDAADDTHVAWRVPIEGGEPQRVGISMRGLMHQQIDPTGRRIVFVGGAVQQEIWIMEHFLPASGLR